MGLIISIINTTVNILTLLVFLYTLLSYFLRPYDAIRRFLAQIVEPILDPIRERVPPTSGFDFSPLILIIVIQIIGMVLVAILRGFQ